MKLALCDDHVTFGEALQTLLNSRGHEVVGWSSSPHIDVDLPRTGVDVIVVDLHFPGVKGCEAVDIVRQAAPAVPIVVLTADADRDLLEQAFDHGANGAVLKTEGINELESVLAKVEGANRNGQLDSARRVRSRQVQALPRQARRGGSGLYLTNRELEVIQMLKKGDTTAEIAKSMGVEISTIRTHIQHLLAKFGAHSRLELVASAMRMGHVRDAP